ncbi:ATP-dependent DNA helicase RecG [Aristophania vespae]|uniref:ATP-dependent DNA helicase RecG n=1 Tax=Aristophania vespae TaxID=2697033 RepID=A0A6P1NL60_9PROT|nr:ATP-dependent DNA helicase RecG [Aristophania vespae]QHI96372.1 ATP-dependent DNA helicase RecG [Aristophania vespae]UMM64742.1 ATP-dependent DNA helicase RecG [Aristophania vespae]
MPISQPPPLLTPLLEPLTSLSGIGPHHASLLSKISGGKKISDLIFTLPERYIDRRKISTVSEAYSLNQGDIFTGHIRIISFKKPTKPSQPFIIHTEDETGRLEVALFRKGKITLPEIGSDIIISGKISFYQNKVSISQPDYFLPWEKRFSFPQIEAVWPLTAGLFPSIVRRAMKGALARLPDLPEWHNAELIQRRQWPSFKQAFTILHEPEKLKDVAHYEPLIERAKMRLAADEILADQLCLALARRSLQQRSGRSLKGNGLYQAELRQRFGYEPTMSQEQAIAEISRDLASPTQMVRLLQGDVGSGKTFVAMMAMLQANEAGAQAALMAPTEILARQHFATISRLCPVSSVFLSGSVKGKERQHVLNEIAQEHAKIIVGTHALFQEGVEFSDLGLAIIDEQHRFGVEQRIKFGNKGTNTDLLVMTATPIPRTMQLAEWGDMGVSFLKEKPANRRPIRTTLHDMSRLDDILSGIQRSLDQGKQIFWVCPLIENSETQSAAAAEDRWACLTSRFGPIVGLAHGKQDHTVRQEALDAFKEGQTRLLVATTVIEVGVDIPNATIMVIEEAERFGLAQLHQLRGRVGRGSEDSFCLLLHNHAASFTARRRLSLLRETEDGFHIADEDFKIRGGGDLAGSRQSGLPGFRLADEMRLPLLIDSMSKEAETILLKKDQENHKLKEVHISLVHLFDRASPERLFRSG